MSHILVQVRPDACKVKYDAGKLVEPLEERALEHDADEADHDRREEERPPVAEARPLQEEVRHEGAHHVQGAVGEVDDVE